MIQYRYLLDENVNLILRNARLQEAPEMTVWRVGDPFAPAVFVFNPKMTIK